MNPATKPSAILPTLLAAALASSSSFGALSAFNQDFEGLVKTDPNALGTDGWLVGANVYDSGGGFIYNYFAFPAPNGGAGFSVISDFPSGGNPPAGAQGLVVYNDYNNADHVNFPTRVIEANVFQEQTVDAGDVGSTWTFSFIASPDNLAAPSTAAGFIKTFNTSGAFVSYLPADTTSLPPGTSSFSIPVTIDPGIGKVQFGFLNTASGGSPSGVNYDNITFSIPEPSLLPLLGLSALAAIRRRR